jgi:hypothetical protein
MGYKQTINHCDTSLQGCSILFNLKNMNKGILNAEFKGLSLSDMVKRNFMRKMVILVLTMLLLENAHGQVKVWELWSQRVTSDKTYSNPYADLTIKAKFTGPDNTEYEVYGYWIGRQNYEISFSFPLQGTWKWELSCSDPDNLGLNKKSGVVNVKEYNGLNKLYQNGFLKVSDNKRHLAYNNNIPFLWLGCTTWTGAAQSNFSEWKKYIDDRANKHFSVIQLTPFENWGKKTKKPTSGNSTSDITKNKDGELPFTGNFDIINPTYWLSLANKIQYANKKGLVVVVIGIPGWQFYFENASQQETFVRYITGLLAGSFVIYSPSSDRPYTAMSDTLAMVLDSMDSRHLITQHPGTPSGKPVNTFAEEYYDKSYLDFSMCQTGHNRGNRELCVWNAIHWNLSLYNREPHKPVINGEAFYHGTTNSTDKSKNGTETDVRSIGWYSWLSGAFGYTYGALGIWNWGKTTDEIFVPWKEALKLNSSYQMKYLADFFGKINWWELEPCPQGVLNQPKEALNQVAFSRNQNGTLAVAYVPANCSAEIDLKQLTLPVNVQWFNPRENYYLPAKSDFTSQSVYHFTAPSEPDQDWVLLFHN